MSRVVVKLGGGVAAQAACRALALVDAGHEVVVVHGAGPQIDAELRRRGLPVEFVHGRRVTNRSTLEVVRESLDRVGTEVCTAVGAAALRLRGDEVGLRARRVPELGHVGEAVPSRPRAILDALASGRIPVVSPLARGPLNVNADDAASALAVGIGADRLVFHSDVPGVLVQGHFASELRAHEADDLLASGAFEGGIVPKLRAAARAARLGVHASIGGTEVVA